MNKCNKCCPDEVTLKIPTRNSFYKLALTSKEKDKLLKEDIKLSTSPITGHLNNLCYVVINNIELKNYKNLPEFNYYSCNKNQVTQEAYTDAVDEMLKRKPVPYVQLFGNPEELFSKTHNMDGSFSELSFVQTDILHNCGKIVSITKDTQSLSSREFIHVRISRNDKFFDLMMKAAGNGDLYANARYIAEKWKEYNKKRICVKIKLITFDIILPCKYYKKYETARISELKIGKV